MNKTSRYLGVAALAAAMVAACSPLIASASPPGFDSTVVAQAVPHGVEASIAEVPWSEVGPGWMLATWSPAEGRHAGGGPVEGQPDPDAVPTTLYLVNPAGGRYAITTFPPSDGMQPSLVDWSGDGGRALFYRGGNGPSTPATLITVDLHTGAQSTFTAAGEWNTTARFSHPDGTAVLVGTSGYPSGPASLERFDLAGNRQLSYPVGKDFTGYLPTRDGTQLVIGAANGLALMGNDGTPGKAMPVAGQEGCTPTRWWNPAATTVVASCHTGRTSRLWLVPIDSGTPTSLTAPNDGQTGPDYGDENAWQVGGATFVQATGACGHRFLGSVNANGTTSEVAVPNVDSHKSVIVIGANGDNLELQATVSCGSGESLLSYNPAAGTSTVLLGPTVNGGGVMSAVPYPGQE
jgi:hypothetical protein